MGKSNKQTQELSRAVARIHAAVLALVFGLMGGFGLFVMTAWLLIKGGTHVGPHLQLLGQYFIGYSVSWGGSVIGFFYGALVGAAAGWVIGKIYNRIVNLRYRS